MLLAESEYVCLEKRFHVGPQNGVFDVIQPFVKQIRCLRLVLQKMLPKFPAFLESQILKWNWWHLTNPCSNIPFTAKYGMGKTLRTKLLVSLTTVDSFGAHHIQTYRPVSNRLPYVTSAARGAWQSRLFSLDVLLTSNAIKLSFKS